jgi:inhibitor of cysteine peptidase
MRATGFGLVVALLMLGGCKTEQDVKQAELSAPVTEQEGLVYADASANGGTVELSVGDTLRVELESIPTAGYIWQVADQPDFLLLTGENTRPTDPDFQNRPGITGGDHYMAFDFTAEAAGTAELRLVEGRPWELEAGEAPDDTFKITVTVLD